MQGGCREGAGVGERQAVVVGACDLVTPVTTNRIQDRRFRPRAWSHSPRACYRSLRSLAHHHYAPPTSYSISSCPHNPTQNTSRPRPNDYSRTQPTSLSALLAQARAAALAFRRTRYRHFAIFSPFPFMYTIVLVLSLPLSRSCCTLIFTFYV